MADRIGQHLGNYRLTRLLGQGGFAEVYLGEHVFLGTTSAIKVLHTQVAPEDMAQFQQEARILASLKHPHIVNILDFGIEERTPYLMMSYAPHGTLRTRHPKGTILSVATVVSYVKQVAQALQYAHECKIVHRDIKPENMLIGERNEILLSDFGIALIAQSSRYQNTTDLIGTIAYMAPEQIAGHPRAASDQYALGIVVYEWICGTRPFHGSFTEIAVQQSVTPPPSPLQHLPTLSPQMEQVIMTTLAKRPEDRFTSVQAMALALEQASQSNLPTERARLDPFSSEFPPSDIPVSPPVTATPLAKPPYQPTDPFVHSSISVPTTKALPSVLGPEKMNEQARALHRKRGTSRYLALLVLIGLVIVALASGLIWSTFSHGASSGSVIHATPTGSVVHHTTPAGNVTEFPVPTSASQPEKITTGSDRNLWFTEWNGNKIGRISTSGAITEFPVPTSASQPVGITTGSDGNLWFTEWNGNKIGRISTSGAITEFPVPTSASEPNGITAGPDGNLWFTGGNEIGRISISGAITEFPVPTSASEPEKITVGPDGNLWFTEWNGNKIGRITSGK
jgi:serine/threonine protein kinase